MFENLVTELTRLDCVAALASDAQRVDQLEVLERVKAACAAAQARVTAEFAASQERVAQEWRARAKECADSSDFDGWVAAREQARHATVEGVDGAGNGGVEVRGAGDGRHGRGGGSRSRRAGASFGVAGQVALARRESPSQGSRHLGMALALVHRLPHTLDALGAGAVSEWRAEIVVRETAVLAAEQQTAVDAELFETLGINGVGRLGDRELARRVRAIA
ncbi:MAG: HNH endonuclease, partial [Lapillicoccus sp.]